MRFVLKTNYGQDINLFQDRMQVLWYVLLLGLLVLAPWGFGKYFQSQMTLLFIWAIAGAGLMLLVGYTGLVSMGHAAFLAIGAYVHAILYELGFPLYASIPISMMVCGLFGILIGIAALRMTGIYLAIATLAFAMIVEKLLKSWSGITGGNYGFDVPEPQIFGFNLDAPIVYYYLCFGVLIVVFLVVINLLRSPTGRSWIAVRDSEIAAQAMGVNLVKTKTLAFAVSAALTGLAGTLYAHQIGFIFPNSFNIITSIKLLILVIVGGVGSMHGIIFGATFIVLLPELISILRDWLPDRIAYLPGLEPLSFGLILIAFLMYEPLGIYGRYVKIRLYFSQYPLYRKKTFKRQKTYLRTERVH